MGTFKDSLKKWFYTNSSSAASSDARIPLLDASGNPKGSDTMDNLASVLVKCNIVGLDGKGALKLFDIGQRWTRHISMFTIGIDNSCCICAVSATRLQDDTISSKFISFGTSPNNILFKVLYDNSSVYIYSNRAIGTSIKILVFRESNAAPIGNFDTTGMTEMTANS